VKVFVYGTLKRGYRNDYFLESAQFVGTGQTVGRFRMLLAGFPVLQWRGHRMTPHHAPVRGEVYECDAATVERLDRLESNGSMYDRQIKRIRLDSGKVIEAQTYIGISRAWRSRKQPTAEIINGVHEWPPRLRETA
jgi:gamma-glutamylcyclotransferase (GGCT)/AIG2-like uncharacterized protein YtfP